MKHCSLEFSGKNVNINKFIDYWMNRIIISDLRALLNNIAGCRFQINQSQSIVNETRQGEYRDTQIIIDRRVDFR